MTHHQQPRGSSVCGQTCVAIIAGVTVEWAITAVGKGRQKTSEHDLQRGLAAFGCVLGKFTRWLGHPPVPKFFTFPALARVRFEGKRHGYHWIAFDGQTVHDPSHKHPAPVDVFARSLRRRRGYITSWAQVEKRARVENFS